MLQHIVNQRNQVFARCKRSTNDIFVQNGLAMSPSQMAELAMNGIPVNNQTLAAYYDDGYSELSYDMPLDIQRGIDVAQLWEEKQRIGKKVVNAHKAELDILSLTSAREGD